MTCPLSPALLTKIRRFFPEENIVWESESPPIGRCNSCNRATWKQSDISNSCLFPQPDGTRCIGRFYQSRMLRAQVSPQISSSDAAGWEAERPLVPKMLLSTLFPHWPVYTPFEALDAWSSTANKQERGGAPRWSCYGPMDPGISDLVLRGFLHPQGSGLI